MKRKRKIYLNKLSLDAARKKFFTAFSDLTLRKTEIAVTEGRGRVLAEPIYARRSAPHYAASAMDGIAVHAADTQAASERNPVSLTGGKDAFWVDTGDAIPEGCNAVIKVEDVYQRDGQLFIEQAAAPWQYIRSIGESVVKGQLVLPVNHQLTSYDLGGLLEAGITRVFVWEKPQVGIIPTGTELVKPQIEPEKGQLIEFSSSMLRGYVEEWGGLAQVTDIIPDVYEEIKETLQTQIDENDITIIIAGSSAGEEDFTVKILQELGEVLVHGVNIMPGKPVILARVAGKPVIGLPGYPLATLLNNYLFVRPLVYQLQGLSAPQTPETEAVIRRKIPSHVGLEEFLRVNLAQINDELVAVPGKRGSAAMDSLMHADGVMVLSEQREGLAPGSKLPVFLLKPEREIKKNLLMIGSHDLTLDLLLNELRGNKSGFDLRTQSVGSMAGLMALKRKECHLAGAHLLDERTGEYNQSFVRRVLAGQKMALIKLVDRQQGLMVQRGNPRGIQGIADLTREDVLYMNRQRGAGTRVLLDYWLKKEGIDPRSIQGYEREEYTHISAAVAVASNTADTALGILAAAQAMDLDFIPLAEERYELVMPYEMLQDWRIEYLLEIIRSDDFRKQIEALGGYKMEQSGEIRIVE